MSYSFNFQVATPAAAKERVAAELARVVDAQPVQVETGIVTFVVPPGAAALEFEFWFDVPCRYDTDELQATLVQHNPGAESYYAWKSVPVVEVPE